MTGLRVVNRCMAVLLGLVLLAVGVGGFLWSAGWIRGFGVDEPGTGPTRVAELVDLRPVTTMTERDWWPWVAVGAAVVLAGLAVWWLAASARRTGVSTVHAIGPAAGGTVAVRTGPVAEQLGRLARRIPGVVGARARLLRGRAATVLALTLQVESDVELARVGAAVETLVRETAMMLGVDHLDVRVHLAVRRRRTARSRVQ